MSESDSPPTDPEELLLLDMAHYLFKGVFLNYFQFVPKQLACQEATEENYCIHPAIIAALRKGTHS